MNPTIIKKEDAQLAEPVQLRDPSPASTSCATAGVRIHENNGHVQAIEVTCACGETTVIELEYSREEATS